LEGVSCDVGLVKDKLFVAPEEVSYFSPVSFVKMQLSTKLKRLATALSPSAVANPSEASAKHEAILGLNLVGESSRHARKSSV